MVMGPAAVGGAQVGLDGVLVSGGVAFDFTAGANALVRLDVRAGRHLLQDHFNGLAAFFALEGEEAGWFRHGRSVSDCKRRPF